MYYGMTRNCWNNKNEIAFRFKINGSAAVLLEKKMEGSDGKNMPAAGWANQNYIFVHHHNKWHSSIFFVGAIAPIILGTSYCLWVPIPRNNSFIHLDLNILLLMTFVAPIDGHIPCRHKL